MARSSKIHLVATREIRQRIKSRAFRIGTAITVGLLLAVSVFSAFNDNGTKTIRMELSTPALSTVISQTAKAEGVTFSILGFSSLKNAAGQLNAGTIDLLVTPTKLFTKNPVSPTDSSTLGRFTNALSSRLSQLATYSALHLTKEQVAGLEKPITVSIEAVGKQPRARSSVEMSLLGDILMFVLISQYGSWVLIGVIEEKASRVIEILLIHLKPLQLLVGKVIGIGVVAVLQAFLLLGSAVLVLSLTGSPYVHGGSLSYLLLLTAWFIAGYSIYCVAYAAAGSLVSRMDDAQSVSIAVQLPIIIGYLLSVTSTRGPEISPIIRVLAFVPGFSSLLMPALYASGSSDMAEQLLAMVICLAATVLLARIGAHIYSKAILSIGGRVKIRQVLFAKAETA